MLLLLQDIRVGTGRGVLLSDPETYNVDVGCSVNSSCETDGVSLCPRDKSTCVSSWHASSCRCHPGTNLTFTICHGCKIVCSVDLL